jgi:YfiH family protein
VADCTPILILDTATRAVAAIHAGWRGTEAQIVRKTLEAMQLEFGTQAKNCWAYVGTCIDECSFEVGPEVAEQFDPAFKRYDAGRYFVDLKRANSAQLQAFGVPADQIETSPYSTVLHVEDYFSYRKEKGQTGRMLCAIGWKQMAG